MSEQHYDANQGAVPPPPAPSQSPTPPPPPSPQNVVAPAVAVPQAGVTFTPMSEKNRRRIKRIVAVTTRSFECSASSTVTSSTSMRALDEAMTSSERKPR